MKKLFGILLLVMVTTIAYSQEIVSVSVYETTIVRKTPLLDMYNNEEGKLKKDSKIYVVDYDPKTETFFVACKKRIGHVSWKDVKLTDDLIKLINARKMGFTFMDDVYLRNLFE